MKITIYNTFKIMVNAGLLISLFILPQALLPLAVTSVLLYFISKHEKYTEIERRYKIKLLRWDGILSLIVIILTVIGLLLSSDRSTPNFDEDTMRERMTDAGFTEEEIYERLDSMTNLEQPNKTTQIFSLLTSGNGERPSKGGLSGNSPTGGRPGGMLGSTNPMSTGTVNFSSILSIINKGLIFIIGAGGLFSSIRTKDTY